MYRRQQYGMVDPRNVAPSRHTIFIRSLPGNMDVGKVKDYFVNETNEKCSVEFFSFTDDKKQLSVAIRFNSHEVAREMLTKYNGKNLFGHQVEVKWFKDLKKARAKLYEEQRQGRPFQRSNFRNNFRNGPDRRGGQSPGNYNSRRGHSRSSSSGANARGQSYRDNLDRGRYSRSRSRSFTGSSSRTPSNSVKSASHSPSRSRQPLRLNSSTRDDYSANKGRNSSGRQTSRNRSHRSPSRSSSTSISSGARKRSNSARNPDRRDRNSRSRPNAGGTSPLAYRNQIQRSQNLSASPEIIDRNLSSYSNAPAPDLNSGSSLVSGLIQLKRRGPSNQQSSNRTTSGLRRRRSSRSSSEASRDLDKERRNSLASKRLRSLSPLDDVPHRSSRNANEASPIEKANDLKRRRTKNTNRSPSSHRHGSNDSRNRRPRTPNIDRTSSNSDSAKQDNSSRTRRTNATKSNRTSAPREKSSTGRRTGTQQHSPEINKFSSDTKATGDQNNFREKNWSSPSITNDNRKRKSENSSDDYDSYASDAGEHANSETKQVNGTEEKKTKEDNMPPSKPMNELPKDVPESMDESIDLIRVRKESLAQDYKRDCEAFTTVVRTLISKDADLEGRLMPMLKEILHERGQRCIEELRAYIAEHQPAAAQKSTLTGQDGLE